MDRIQKSGKFFTLCVLRYSIVALIFFGVAISSRVTPVSAATNLIANPSMEQAGTNNAPLDWVKGRWGTNTTVFTYPVPGSQSEKAGKVQITSYTNGDAKWAFKPVTVEAGGEYTFSNMYISSVTSYLTAEFKLSNGTTVYKDLLTLSPASQWTKSNASFIAPPNATSVSVYHLIKSVGEITVDEYVLEKKTTPPPPPPDPTNLVLNPSFETADTNGNPTNWTKGRWGTNTTGFEYPVTGQSGARAAKITMSARSTGDAKWVFKDVAVESGKIYKFSDYYIADVPTYITARYTLSNGNFSYIDLALLPPTTTWEKTEHSFTVPAGVISVTVLHIINQVGTLTTDTYSLVQDSTQVPPTKGIVSLTFDDGWKSIYQNAIPILNNAGIKSTQYINPSRFTFPAYVTAQEVLAMQSSGHEIGSHTKTHPDLTTLSAAEARAEIEGSKQDLLAIGVKSVNTFAYPFGAYNDSVKQMVMDAGYLSARSSDGGFNKKGTLNLYALARHPVNSDTTPTQIKSWIDQAVANDLWLILVFHNVDTSGSVYSTTPAILQETVDYLKSKNVKVVTLSDGVELMK